MKLYIKLEAVPGQSIEEVCEEMCKAATRLDLHVQLNFNGILLLCHPSDNMERILNQWRNAIQK